MSKEEAQKKLDEKWNSFLKDRASSIVDDIAYKTIVAFGAAAIAKKSKNLATSFIFAAHLLKWSDDLIDSFMTAKSVIELLGAYAEFLKAGGEERFPKQEYPNVNNRNTNYWFPDWNSSKSIPDPLAIDLDGNGISFTKNSAYFDMDNNGFAEKSTWINSSDGVLAKDVNGDGKVNNGSELFGDAMRKKDGTLVLVN